jgi:hypothetical protein
MIRARACTSRSSHWGCAGMHCASGCWAGMRCYRASADSSCVSADGGSASVRLR